MLGRWDGTPQARKIIIANENSELRILKRFSRSWNPHSTLTKVSGPVRLSSQM